MMVNLTFLEMNYVRTKALYTVVFQFPLVKCLWGGRWVFGTCSFCLHFRRRQHSHFTSETHPVGIDTPQRPEEDSGEDETHRRHIHFK